MYKYFLSLIGAMGIALSSLSSAGVVGSGGAGAQFEAILSESDINRLRDNIFETEFVNLKSIDTAVRTIDTVQFRTSIGKEGEIIVFETQDGAVHTIVVENKD